MRGLFVTGTDTGVGKTVLAACIAAALTDAGLRVAAYKPVVTGLDDRPDADWPPDHALLGRGAGRDAVVPHRYGPPVSPHLAAELVGEELTLELLVDSARAAAADGADVLIAEGVGGLLVPLTPRETVRDLAAALSLPVVVAARPGLGTISHTLLTVEAARTSGLDVRAVVLTPWPDDPSVMERSNRETIAGRAGVEVATLPRLRAGSREELRRGGAHLQPQRWL